MEDEGLAVWLIPSEFMDVNYGAALRRYLSERVTLLQIHRFCPTDVQFTDALVSSAVVIFRKSPRRQVMPSASRLVARLNSPQTEAPCRSKRSVTSRKWTQFPVHA